MDIDEDSLVKGIKDRDQDVLSMVIEGYGKLVLYIISKILDNEKERQFIDDCYNEVFTVLWFNIECFDSVKGNFKSWLIGISKYKALEFKKRCIIDKSVYMDEVQYEGVSADNYEIETTEEVMSILEDLEEKDKGIFLKRYIDGYSIKDIAKVLGVTSDYIYNRISRGRRKIIEKQKGGLL